MRNFTFKSQCHRDLMNFLQFLKWIYLRQQNLILKRSRVIGNKIFEEYDNLYKKLNDNSEMINDEHDKSVSQVSIKKNFIDITKYTKNDKEEVNEFSTLFTVAKVEYY